MNQHKMKDPKLSIVMPVFNHPEETRVMIDSIRANSFPDWELLAVDDGSEAATLRLLEGYAEQDSRIRLIRRTRLPKGAPTCRNIGLDAARGEYIAFFDSDDYVPPYALATRVESLAARPELGFMVFPSGTYDSDGFHPEPGLYTYGYPIYANDLELFARRLLPFVVWNNLYRTAALRRSGVRWDEQLLSLQDADFNVTTLLAGIKYDYANVSPDYGYRIGRTGSVSMGLRTEVHFRSHIHAIRKMYLCIRQHHGTRYNKALDYGTLRIYHGVMTGEGINMHFANMLADELQDLSPRQCSLLRLQAKTSQLLSRILPQKLARQLPMLAHLLSHCHNQRCKLRSLAKLTKPNNSL